MSTIIFLCYTCCCCYCYCECNGVDVTPVDHCVQHTKPFTWWKDAVCAVVSSFVSITQWSIGLQTNIYAYFGAKEIVWKFPRRWFFLQNASWTVTLYLFNLLCVFKYCKVLESNPLFFLNFNAYFAIFWIVKWSIIWIANEKIQIRGFANINFSSFSEIMFRESCLFFPWI